MLRPALVIAALVIATPAVAGVKMTIENRSSVTVSGINSFPVDENGEDIEDNLGGLFDDVGPGSSATFELNGDCRLTRFFVRIAGQRGDDLEIDLNTCKSRTIIVGD